MRNSLRSKSTSGSKPRMHLSPVRGGGGNWSLQPEQVDRVFQALRKGLKYVDQREFTLLWNYCCDSPAVTVTNSTVYKFTTDGKL